MTKETNIPVINEIKSYLSANSFTDNNELTRRIMRFNYANQLKLYALKLDLFY